MATLIRVLLVDDHPLSMDGLGAALGADRGIEVVGRAQTQAQGRAALQRLQPHVAVLDIHLPDGSGLQLVGLVPDTRYLLLSYFGAPQYVDAAKRLGASGFFLKTAPTPSLVAAVKRIAAGGSAFDPEALRAAREGSWEPLTTRQKEIVRLVMEGRSNDEVGAHLHVSSKTVEAYLGRLFARFKVDTRLDLALRAEREGWLDLPALDEQNGDPA